MAKKHTILDHPSDVKFIWNHKGESKITQVFKNLLED